MNDVERFALFITLPVGHIEPGENAHRHVCGLFQGHELAPLEELRHEAVEVGPVHIALLSASLLSRLWAQDSHAIGIRFGEHSRVVVLVHNDEAGNRSKPCSYRSDYPQCSNDEYGEIGTRALSGAKTTPLVFFVEGNRLRREQPIDEPVVCQELIECKQ